MTANFKIKPVARIVNFHPMQVPDQDDKDTH